MIRRRRRERGVALIEIAIVSPIVFALVFAIMEYGLTFRDQLTAQDAVGDAARLGAIVGPDVTSSGSNADFEIIRTLRDGLGNVPTSWVTRIVVFQGSPGGAGAPERQITATCRNGTAVANVCNVFPVNRAFAAVQDGDTDYFDCNDNPTGPSCSWDPVDRDDGPLPTDIDYVGVYVRIDRPGLTGLFGSTRTVERASIVRLEPGATLAGP